VVDIRFNGGGDLHNNLLTLLSGKEYSRFTAPNGPSQREPRDRWSGRSAVLMNGASYSDASVFPFAYRVLGLGQLVGTTVAGTGTYVWWVESNLIPGLIYGLPQLPLRGLDGTLLENHDIPPDVASPDDPKAWSEGTDPQLAAALTALGAKACPK
jgi:tricorn protease